MINDDKQPTIIDYEGSDYQTSFWDEGSREYEDRTEIIALKHLLPTSGNLLLELGAGAGRNTPRYHNFDKIVLVDYSYTQLEQAQERLGVSDRYIYVAADVYRLPFVNSLFDATTMIRVLHHISDPSMAVTQIQRVLKHSGSFILEFASKRHLKAIIRYLFRKQDWSPFDRDQVELIKLNFNFHPESIFELLKETGFSIQDIRTVSHFRIVLMKKLIPAKLLAWADGILQPTGRLWQFTPSLFVKSQLDKPYEEAIGFFMCLNCQSAELIESEQEISCTECGKTYPIRNGIYDFRI